MEIKNLRQILNNNIRKNVYNLEKVYNINIKKDIRRDFYNIEHKDFVISIKVDFFNRVQDFFIVDRSHK